MVEIIKDGKLGHEQTCRNCGCIFSYEAEDVTREVVWDDHGGHYPAAEFYKIDCPFCKKEIDLPSRFSDKEIGAMKRVDK